MKHLLIILVLALEFNAFGQIPDGSIAPDFTLNDLNGNTHNLYAYLDNGKTVFLEIFAAHCPSCWNYHQTDRLKNMYNAYGPDGTDEIMVLALEHDEYNDMNAFLGIGDPWVTQGNWLDGTPYPLFNVEFPDRDVFIDYNVNFYPVIYKICPDKVVERVYPSTTEAQLYQGVQACQTVSIDEVAMVWSVHYDQGSRSVIVQHSKPITSLNIMNLSGQIVKTINSRSYSRVDVNDLAKGVYLLEFKTGAGSIIEKLSLY
jgi:hypothetical protein